MCWQLIFCHVGAVQAPIKIMPLSSMPVSILKHGQTTFNLTANAKKHIHPHPHTHTDRKKER